MCRYCGKTFKRTGGLFRYIVKCEVRYRYVRRSIPRADLIYAQPQSFSFVAIPKVDESYRMEEAGSLAVSDIDINSLTSDEDIEDMFFTPNKQYYIKSEQYNDPSRSGLLFTASSIIIKSYEEVTGRRAGQPYFPIAGTEEHTGLACFVYNDAVTQLPVFYFSFKSETDYVMALWLH